MRKFIGVFLLSITFSLALVSDSAAKKAQTQNIDFANYTCASFLKELAGSNDEDAGAVLLWLDGYLSGVSGDTVLNFKGLEEFSGKLVTHCKNKGDDRLLEAAKEVGIQQ
ncbi:MAG: hypothetical protein HQL73_13920 [Magnetococcales bacterium]|nr:hypothetical protein [Magnetococcales bacterium]